MRPAFTAIMAATAAEAAPARKRILCLHGFRQTAAVFREKTGALRKALKGVAELDYLDAPHAAAAGGAWWHASAGGAEYVGFDASVAHVRAHIAASGPYDGVLGFSQGAVFASLLAGLGAARAADAPELHALQFAVLVSGFGSRAVAHAAAPWYADIALPSLHVWGAADGLVPAAASAQLARRFRDAATLEHAGAHAVPGGDALRDIAAFVAGAGAGPPAAAPPGGLAGRK